MKRILFSRPVLGLGLLALPLFLAASARAENPDPLSLVIEKDYPTQGMVGFQGGMYESPHHNDSYALPLFYYGTKQVSNWTLFNTPVEFDLGRSAQLSLRNIDGTPWSVGAGLNYNETSIRERSGTTTMVPGADLDTAGPYAFTRYQATKQLGIELSERLDYYDFSGSGPYTPKDFFQTETRLLVDYDRRHMDPRPEVLDSGFYAAAYGFSRQLPANLYDNPTGSAFGASQRSHGTDGGGGRIEQLWQPWLSGNIGVVVDGEITANTDLVYLSDTEGTRSRGNLYPHLLVNQNMWPGGSIEINAGPKMMYERFGQANNNPIFLTTDLTLSQAVSEHVNLAFLFGYDEDRYKATYTGQDQTGGSFFGMSTTYHW